MLAHHGCACRAGVLRREDGRGAKRVVKSTFVQTDGYVGRARGENPCVLGPFHRKPSDPVMVNPCRWYAGRPGEAKGEWDACRHCPLSLVRFPCLPPPFPLSTVCEQVARPQASKHIHRTSTSKGKNGKRPTNSRLLDYYKSPVADPNRANERTWVQVEGWESKPIPPMRLREHATGSSLATLRLWTGRYFTFAVVTHSRRGYCREEDVPSPMLISERGRKRERASDILGPGCVQFNRMRPNQGGLLGWDQGELVENCRLEPTAASSHRNY